LDVWVGITSLGLHHELKLTIMPKYYSVT